MKILAIAVSFIVLILASGCAASTSKIYGVSKPFSITTEFLRASGNGTGNTIREATENAILDASMKLEKLLPDENINDIKRLIITDTLQIVLNGDKYSAHLSLRKAYKLTIAPSRVTMPPKVD
ncbi:MAG: hypothetical protein ABSF47_02325 [Minisyncoccia bacterium]|jgi:hypothetical protein